MNNKTLVFFDLETSGLDKDVHAIIQIAAIAVKMPVFQEIETFECKIKFKIENASPEALKVNSYDPDVWEREAISPFDAELKFSDFLRKYATVAKISRTGNPYQVAQLAGHNVVNFDVPFLQGWYKRLGNFLPASWFALDTLSMALQNQFFLNVDYPNLKLETLCKYHGISTGQSHNALDDIRMTVALAKVLHDQIILNGAESDMSESAKKAQSIIDGLPDEYKVEVVQ